MPETDQQLPEDVEQVLLGSLFGDGGLRKQSKGKNIEFRETHSIKQKDYLLWKKALLSQTFIITSYFYSLKDKRNGHIYKGLEIRSCVNPLLTNYYSNFYPKGKKLISLEMLNKLKPLGLAVWYMDDGSYEKKGNNAIIASNKQNIEIIQRWFKEIQGIGGFIYKSRTSNSATIRFNVKDTKKLFRIIHSYIHPSMKYKIKRTREEYLIIKKKRREIIERYRDKYPEKFKNYMKKYYKKYTQKISDYNKKYRERNKFKISKRRKENYQNNKDKILKKRREYYQKNRQQILKEKKEHYKTKQEII